MDYFSSLWFKIGLALFALLAVYGILVYLMMDKIVKQTLDSPSEKRLKLVRSLSKAMPTYKMVLWILPLYLLVIPSIHSLDPQLSYSLITVMTFMYLALLEGFVISKKLLEVIGKQKVRLND